MTYSRVFAVVLAMAMARVSGAQPPAEMPVTQRTDRIARWELLRYGAFVHYNMNTYGPARADGGLDDFYGGDCQNPDLFHPTQLDIAGWVRSFKEAGMGYAVLTARHLGGFLLWDSATTSYDSVHSQFAHTDIVAEFLAQCRLQGIEPGIYYLMGGGSHDLSSCPLESGRRFDRQAVFAQLTELATHYGKIPYFWIDMMDWRPLPGEPGAIATQEIYSLLKKLQPDAVVHFNQHSGPGSWVHYFPTDVMNGEETLPRAGYRADRNVMTFPTDPYSLGTDDFAGYVSGKYYLPFEYSMTSQVGPTEQPTTPVGFFRNTLWFTRGATQMEDPRLIYPQLREAYDRGAARALLAAAPDESGAMKVADAEKLKFLGNLIDAHASLKLEPGSSVREIQSLGPLAPAKSPASSMELRCELQSGDQPIVIRKLGRFRALGNHGIHTLSLLDSNGEVLGRAQVVLKEDNADLQGFVYGPLEKAVTLPAHSRFTILGQQSPLPDASYPQAVVVRAPGALVTGECSGPLDFVTDAEKSLAYDLSDPSSALTGLKFHGVKIEPGVGAVFEGHHRLEFANTGAWDAPGPIRLEVRIAPERVDGLRNILAHGYTLAPRGEVFLRIHDGHYEAGSFSEAGIDLVSAPTPNEDLHAFVEIAAEYDGRSWRLFRNGRLLAEHAATIGVPSVPASWAIGACARGVCAGGENRGFVGVISHVEIRR